MQSYLELCAGRDVLLCGLAACGRVTPEQCVTELTQLARRVIVLDIRHAALEPALRAGAEAVVADAENFSLPCQVDVVLCWKILQHLSNAGAFLQCVRGALHPPGHLIIKTANVDALVRRLYVTLGLLSRTDWANPHHVALYDAETLCHLLSKYRFRVERLSFQSGSRLGAMASSIRAHWSDDLLAVSTMEPDCT